MKKNLYIVIGLAVLIALSILGSTLTFASPLDKHLHELTSSITLEEWERAREINDHIQSEWKRRKLLISFNNTYTDMQEFERVLARLNAYLNIEDKAGAASQIADLGELWKRFDG